MTNEEIVVDARIRLMKEGKIRPTGRKFVVTDAEGKEIVVEEPEEIHTYAHWASLGYQVQKGQKAIAMVPIWKHAVSVKTDEESGEEVKKERMFLKTAAFFARHQVDEVA